MKSPSLSKPPASREMFAQDRQLLWWNCCRQLLDIQPRQCQQVSRGMDDSFCRLALDRLRVKSQNDVIKNLGSRIHYRWVFSVAFSFSTNEQYTDDGGVHTAQSNLPGIYKHKVPLHHH